MIFDVAVIGAGISGLACARTLTDAGCSLTVLERSRGVGGRCATRRIRGQAVDHGVAFLHGSDPDFVRAIHDVVGGTVLEGWPSRVTGAGLPCQPEAFEPLARRLAYAQGLTVFPKSLATGIPIRFASTAVELSRSSSGGVMSVRCDDGSSVTAHRVVLGLPVTQAEPLLEGLGQHSAEAAAARVLMRLVGVVPSLTVMAGYPTTSPVPDWQLLYPDDSSVLQLVSLDSDKRPDPRFTVLVLQARARWSETHKDESPEAWAREMIAEAARRIGSWVGEPEWIDVQRWRYARAAGEGGMRRPLLVRFDGGGAVGLAGESLGASGGVETAWLSGRGLAKRIMEEG